METAIADIRRDMRQKATLNRLEQVEIHLHDYATKEELRRCRSLLESYTSLESFNKNRMAQDHFNNELRDKMTTLVSQVQLTSDLAETKLWFETLNAENSQKRDCLKDRKDMERMCDKIQQDMKDLRDDHRASKDRIRVLEVNMPEKVEKFALQEVKEFMQLLPTKEEVTSLRTYTRTNIDKFQEDNAEFKEEFDGHLSIIRRYDEVLSEKANKHSVAAVEFRVNEQFKPAMKIHDERITANLKILNETKESMLEFKGLIREEIYMAIKKQVVNEIKIFERNKKDNQPQFMGLSRILNEGEDGLLKVLSLKADQNDLEKLHEMKSNKVDTESLVDLIIEMNRLV